jgi:hypothetical protein
MLDVQKEVVILANQSDPKSIWLRFAMELFDQLHSSSSPSLLSTIPFGHGYRSNGLFPSGEKWPEHAFSVAGYNPRSDSCGSRVEPSVLRYTVREHHS